MILHIPINYLLKINFISKISSIGFMFLTLLYFAIKHFMSLSCPKSGTFSHQNWILFVLRYYSHMSNNPQTFKKQFSRVKSLNFYKPNLTICILGSYIIIKKMKFAWLTQSKKITLIRSEVFFYKKNLNRKRCFVLEGFRCNHWYLFGTHLVRFASTYCCNL